MAGQTEEMVVISAAVGWCGASEKESTRRLSPRGKACWGHGKKN